MEETPPTNKDGSQVLKPGVEDINLEKHARQKLELDERFYNNKIASLIAELNEIPETFSNLKTRKKIEKEIASIEKERRALGEGKEVWFKETTMKNEKPPTIEEKKR
ncbi:MAG: hypothetical protein WC822_03025 [Candidatus Paceibacterota bacterium]|jgi:hypothetical protein